MKKHILACVVSILSVALIGAADPTPKTFPPPGEIVAAAQASDWVAIAPSDLLIMDLAPDSKGRARSVVIQLMPAPFSQGWVSNIRKLVSAGFWDGTSINRVQDNYVVQWGDVTEKKALPDGLQNMSEDAYVASRFESSGIHAGAEGTERPLSMPTKPDPYGDAGFWFGWPVGRDKKYGVWPTHCYGMVGVGRNLSPDTGTGAELYTVIGHAPRHLDRNIALVGRIIEGMENMSSLPRGTGDLGFYKTPEERTAILSVRLMSEMGNDKPLPTYEYLNTESASFAKYADARANRRDPFFIKPAGGADICNIPVPVQRMKR
jgi:cyclophilin family peptidyl-prolyl cis-trans isomerase